MLNVPDSDERISPTTYALAAIQDDILEPVIRATSTAADTVESTTSSVIGEGSFACAPPPPGEHFGLDEPAPQELLPAKILAWEPSWTILSNDYCVQV